MPVTIVVGEQRGDEGKGRFVDMLAENTDIVARFNGGPNAGHTAVLPDGQVLETHLLPTGVAHKNVLNVIGNGTFLDPVKLLAEITNLKAKGIILTPATLKISSAAHLITPHHVVLDMAREEDGQQGQGSTKVGIAFVAGDKYQRTGLRAEDILSEKQLVDQPQEWIDACHQLKDYITDTVVLVNAALKNGQNVLAEGAQAFLLDIDHGMYPFVTSSSTTTGGVLTGLGVSPKHIERVIGVAKATQSHVGGGPFVTEITDEKLLKNIQGEAGKVDTEQGTTTGRWRRMGHFDLPQLRRAQMVNGSSELAITKLDCLSRYGDEIPMCVAYECKGQKLSIAPGSAAELEQCQPIYQNLPNWQQDIQAIRKFDDLPANAQSYIKFIEDQTTIPISMIGVGPSRDQVIIRQI